MPQKTTQPHRQYTFMYKGRNKRGSDVSGIVLAVSLAMAKADLRRQGITPTHVHQKRESFFGNRKKSIKPLDIALFSRQMATMMKSGVAVMESFDIVAKGFSNSHMQPLLYTIKSDVESGMSMAESLAKHPLYFDNLYVNLIRAGEQSGTLDVMLDRIATYKEKTEILKGKVKKALYYPAAVIAVAIIVTTILLVWVVPQFEALFKNFHADLPLFTQFVLDLSRGLQHYWFIILLVIAGGVYAFNRAIKQSKKFAEAVDVFILKIYIIGDILNKSAIARYARTLSTTFAAGVPLLEGLESVAGATGNSVFTKAITQIKEDVATGQPLQAAMRNSNIFPNMVVQMVAIGEESGSLDHMLGKVADFYEAEVDNKVDALASLLEPVIIVVLGVLVGGLIIAMYLPIFKMGSVIG